MTSGDFGIGVLAQRAGTTPGALRAWEHRYGLEVGHRTTAGHRRYTDHDVVVVRELLAAKESGLPLKLAVAEASARQRPLPSVHGELTRAFPELPSRRLSRRTLVAVSRAIEDECLARGDRPVVLGAFQAGHRFAESEERWRELARTAAWCAVVADFGTGAADTSAAPVRCDLPEDAPMRREWSVVVLGDELSVVLSAWEVPGSGGATYESVLSTGEACAARAARTLLGVLEEHGATPPPAVRRRVGAPTIGSAVSPGDRLLTRVLEQLDRATDRAT